MRKIFIFKITQKNPKDSAKQRLLSRVLLNEISESLSAPLIFKFHKNTQGSKTGHVVVFLHLYFSLKLNNYIKY